MQRLQVLVGDWVWGLRKEAPRSILQFLSWACWVLFTEVVRLEEQVLWERGYVFG